MIAERISVDTYNQTLSDTSIPVRVGNAKDSLPAVLACFHPTQDPISSTDGSAHAMGTGSKRGCSSHAVCVTGHRTHALTTRARACEEDGTGRGTPIVTQGGAFSRDAFGGNRSSGPLDVATSCLANGSPQGRQDFASETFVVEGYPDPAYAISAGQQGKGGVFGSGRDSQDTFVSVAFKPSHYTRGKDGAPSEVVAPLSADADKGDQDTVIATPIDLRQASRGEKVTNNRSQGSGGPPGHGVGDAGDPAFTVSERGQAVVSIDLQNVTVGGDLAGTLDTTRPSRGGGQAVAVAVAFDTYNQTLEDKSDQDTIVAAPFTKAKRAQSSSDDETWVPGEVAPTQNQFDQGDTRATTVVAFAQNQLGEVRVNPDVMGTVNQNQNASGRNTPMVFANRTRDGIKVPEVMKDGVVPALTNPGNGGRADAVNIQQAMQVRRLCPAECEALQGFPVGYTDVTYRNKPACDGPRYRALGNSMAVPCMWWLGHRIAEATG